MKRNKEAEIDTDYLENRILLNEKRQKKDLNKWVFENLDNSFGIKTILELCAGTGKQSEYLSKIDTCESLTCIDLSAESIKFIGEQAFYDPAKMTLQQSDIDSFLEGKGLYDLVFCSYGLYYSSDTDKLLKDIYDHLSPGGSAVIVGPYGKNNIQLFDVLRSCGVTIGELVMHSSSTFMMEGVWKHAIEHYDKINVRTMVNPFYWNSKEDIINYWKNSTFYDGDKEGCVADKLSAHFDKNESFINEKHIMFIQMTKDAGQ